MPKTHTEYRIECRPPGRDRWEYRSFTGAFSTDLRRIASAMARLPERCPGWEFRIRQREVTVDRGEWEPTGYDGD